MIHCMSCVLLPQPATRCYTYTNDPAPVFFGSGYSILAHTPASPAATCRMGSNEAIHSPTLISLVAKSPFSPCSNPLGLTSAAPVCNLFAQSEQSHSRQATSMATLKLCSGQASAMVYSGSVALPAQARCHHFQTAACHLAFLSLSKFGLPSPLLLLAWCIFERPGSPARASHAVSCKLACSLKPICLSLCLSVSLCASPSLSEASHHVPVDSHTPLCSTSPLESDRHTHNHQPTAGARGVWHACFECK